MDLVLLEVDGEAVATQQEGVRDRGERLETLVEETERVDDLTAQPPVRWCPVVPCVGTRLRETRARSSAAGVNYRAIASRVIARDT